MTSPVLWYLNRGTGLVLLVLFTLTTLLGILASGAGAWVPGRRRRFVPAFASQALHRSIALMSVALLTVHVATAVLDEFVDIRWWQTILPFGGTYRPLYLALGAISLDLTVAVTVTALLRHRVGTRVWRAIHLFSYAAWLAAVVHAVGIGTDAANALGLPVVASCASVVFAGLLFRVLRRTPREVSA